jgi:hypothetical protein
VDKARADRLAAMLDLDLALQRICHACLSFVSFPLDHGDERRARIEARKMAPWLWDDGLEEPALAAVRQARVAGVPDAEDALVDLERLGPRSRMAQAIVLRLAAELARRTKIELAAIERTRQRLTLVPPELN